jgi:hypothetical protein
MAPSDIISDYLIRLEAPFTSRGNEPALDADTWPVPREILLFMSLLNRQYNPIVELSRQWLQAFRSSYH